MVSALQPLVETLIEKKQSLCVLTGAGISAESGIPTFRGPEGYWRQGSTVYQPMELATASMFHRHPTTVWSWYLYRRAVCLAAQPNSAHRALATLEQQLPSTFTLITQNVDGLHQRAGSTQKNTLPIHGQIDQMRCTRECSLALYPIPAQFDHWSDQKTLSEDDFASHLRCPQCGAPTRPHVLWFDECYDEAHFHFDSALERAAEAVQLWVIGTSGQTNLPNMLVNHAVQLGTMLVEINPEPSDFSDLILQSGGLIIRESASAALEPILKQGSTH